MKKLIKLTENDIHKIVKKTLNKAINEIHNAYDEEPPYEFKDEYELHIMKQFRKQIKDLIDFIHNYSETISNNISEEKCVDLSNLLSDILYEQ